MRADICEPSDTAALICLKRALHALGAEPEDDFDSSLGVRVYQVRVGGDVLTVFSDNWSVDIEGPPALVERVVTAMKEL